MATIQELINISNRNNAYIEARFKGEVESKCYDCAKWTYHGKTCKGKCEPTDRVDG